MLYVTILAGLALALAAVLVGALLVERKATAELLAHFEVMHQEERARLVGAIQRPDLIQRPQPVRAPSQEDVEKRQRWAKELASVGTVTHGKPNDAS